MESSEDERIDRVDSLDLDLESTSSSGLSSFLSAEGSRTSSGSSGEIPAILPSESVAPRLLEIAPAEVSGGRRVRCVDRSGKGVAWGSRSVIGRRSEMEDAVAVVPEFMSCACDDVGGCAARTAGEISAVHFFGVYDGHGGSQVANFCGSRMHEVIAEEWDTKTVEGHEWQRRWEETFINGFARTDSEVRTDKLAPEMVGSTAAVVVLSGCQIITANCGDSRVVLCRTTKTIPLTVDQKPDREDELLRIEGDGGKVINWNGARVFGVLAMSRAIGDWYLRPWVIPVPEISFTTRTEDDECLILASDGLWDVMTNDEVGEVARSILRRRRRLMADNISPAQAVADNLTDIAYARNSSDNISVIVVHLKAWRRRQQRQPGPE